MLESVQQYNIRRDIRAFIFDLDGVITDTQDLHAQAWKEMFNEFLARRRGTPENSSELLGEFKSTDYFDYIDGRPREDGIKTFLEARKILSTDEVVESLAQTKNNYFLNLLKLRGAHIIKDSVSFLRMLKESQVFVALVSSSRNAHTILKEAGLEDSFDTIVTPLEADSKKLQGKPSPDYFLEASHSLGLDPASCAVVEDSLAGVIAARKGGFKKVIGLNHFGDETKLRALKEVGADEAVVSLWDLEISKSALLPNLLTSFHDIFPSGSEANFFLFLDFDGTLSPIVDDPEIAEPLEGVTELINQLRYFFNICIITGRDTSVIKNKMKLDNVFYAACHGFEITGPEDFIYQVEEARASIPDLNEAQIHFGHLFQSIPGFVMERKMFGLALHYRMVKSPQMVQKIRADVLKYPRTGINLKVQEGEMVIELLPRLDWDKGKAVLEIYKILGIGTADLPPLYIGDGLTDEDAFREISQWGIAVFASVDQRPTMASFHLKGPHEVKAFLAKLLELKTRGEEIHV